MQGEFGGCELKVMTLTKVTNTCTACGKQIHDYCDMFKHKKHEKGEDYKCPKCK